MPTHDPRTAEPQQRGNEPPQLDPLPKPTKGQRAQMLSRESGMASLNGQISSLQELGMTSSEIRDAMPGSVLNRSAEPKAPKQK